MRTAQRFGVVLFAVFLGFFFVSPANASSVKEVLGDSTEASDVDFPALSSGPGFILPDSTWYPLDQLVQEVRLMLAFTPEQQTEVHLRIAGERLAELREMLRRDNRGAADVALIGFEKEVTAASASLADARANSRGTDEQVRSVNTRLGEFRDVLVVASLSAPESLALKLEGGAYRVLEAKLSVIDELPETEIASALENDLERELDTQVLGVENAFQKVERRLVTFEDKASQAAERKFREIENKASGSAERLRVQEERALLLEEYRLRKDELLEERKAKLAELKEAIARARELAKELRELSLAQQALAEEEQSEEQDTQE